MILKSKAETFSALHGRGRILVLANVWDVASARIVQAAGAAAIATSSAGVANSLGYADGEHISREQMMETVARIARAVDLPVTIDAEAGYGPRPEDAAETTRQVIAAGGVGMNLEDGAGDPASPLFDVDRQVERIRAVREVVEAHRIPFVLNARTDVYLAAVGPPEARFAEAVRRANAYRDAGADCLFVPGVTDAETIQNLVQAIQGPLNILAAPGAPPVDELERLGVARVSTGSSLMRACFTKARDVAHQILGAGSWDGLLSNSITYREMNDVSAARHPKT